MSQGPLDFLPLWALFLATVAIVLLAIEAGFRLGERRRRTRDPEKDSSVGSMVGASLGLLAFLLGFTFGLAASRFEARRQVLLDEVNAIETTYLRAATLPEPARSEARDLLRQYIETRVEATAPGNLDAAIGRSEELQGRLWTVAATLGQSQPGSIMVGLFMQSLNEVIDLHTTRILTGLRSRIPAVIWVVLYGITILSMAELGYQSGLSGTRRPLSIPAVAIAFAAVMLLIADLDRPLEGTIRVDQQMMRELRDRTAVPRDHSDPGADGLG
jgi:hypothetical protein